MGPLAAPLGVGQDGGVDVSSANNQFVQLMNSLIGEEPAAFATQQTFGPQFTALTGQEVGSTAGSLNDIISQFLPGITSSTNTANTSAATAGAGNVSTAGPLAAAGINLTNPAQASLLAGINDTAASGLKAGTTLDPSDKSQIDNSVNANWASRGLGTSAPAQLDQALQEFAGGQNLLTQREGAAGTAASLDSSLVTMPSVGISQETSTAPGQMGQLLGLSDQIAGPSGNTLTDPTSVLSGAFNAQAASQITTANNEAALSSY